MAIKWFNCKIDRNPNEIREKKYQLKYYLEYYLEY
jgi:hypothetical protein